MDIILHFSVEVLNHYREFKAEKNERRLTFIRNLKELLRIKGDWVYILQLC